LPPQEVLDACNFDNSTTQQESIFIPGQVTISYTGSSVPDALLVDGSNLVTSTDAGTPFDGFAALKGPDGTWSCTDDVGEGGGGVNLTLNFADPFGNGVASGRYAGNFNCSIKALVGLYAKPRAQC
jgi:hypothetical protein